MLLLLDSGRVLRRALLQAKPKAPPEKHLNLGIAPNQSHPTWGEGGYSRLIITVHGQMPVPELDLPELWASWDSPPTADSYTQQKRERGDLNLLFIPSARWQFITAIAVSQDAISRGGCLPQISTFDRAIASNTSAKGTEFIHEANGWSCSFQGRVMSSPSFISFFAFLTYHVFLFSSVCR